MILIQGVLNQGETWKFFGNYTVTQEDITSNGCGDGFIENTATVSCNELSSESNSVKQPILLTLSDGNGTASDPTTDQSENENSGDNGGSSGSSSGSSGGSSGGACSSPEPAKNVEVKELSQAFITNGKAVKFDFTKNATCVCISEF